MKKKLVAAGFGALLMMGVMAGPASAAPLDGTRTCAAIDATLSELKLDDAPEVGDVVTDGTLTVTITAVATNPDGEAIGFKGTASGATVQYVIVKAGQGTKVYTGFVGGLLQTPSGDFLFTPGQAVTGKKHHQEISYIAFCY